MGIYDWLRKTLMIKRQINSQKIFTILGKQFLFLVYQYIIMTTWFNGNASLWGNYGTQYKVEQ